MMGHIITSIHHRDWQPEGRGGLTSSLVADSESPASGLAGRGGAWAPVGGSLAPDISSESSSDLNDSLQVNLPSPRPT